MVLPGPRLNWAALSISGIGSIARLEYLDKQDKKGLEISPSVPLVQPI